MVEARGSYESKYTEHEKLDEDSFWTAYLVTHKVENKKYVAMKVKIGPDPSDLIDKLSEVKLLQELKHPNIVSCKEFFITQDINILVMEYCECKFSTLSFFSWESCRPNRRNEKDQPDLSWDENHENDHPNLLSTRLPARKKHRPSRPEA